MTTNEEIKRFEVGKSYRSVTGACIEIISRTPKMATYRYMERVKKSKIFIDEYQRCEYVRPDNYSMAPRFFATKEILLNSRDERTS